MAGANDESKLIEIRISFPYETMKINLLIAMILICVPRLPAQTNDTVRLALIAESSDASAAADVLTAEFSSQKKLQLLERNEIEKVYREQGLSAGNRDYLKLGQILGADGLLILHLVKVADSQRLSVRLVAVKPGVALRQREYPWPLDNQLQWAGVVVSQFQPLFFKLDVLPGEAVPISILNLRSAVASVEGQTLERGLTQLLYARLIDEKDIFVLERRRMELLADENQWNKSGENTFWNGSYLVEGSIDKAGFQKDLITIEVRLTPPDKTGVLTVEVSGARTNLPAVVNELAVRIMGALKKGGGSAVWNPEAEAGQYFTEAQWMLKWGMVQEAKSAGETAWALGRQNRQAAELRIKAYQACAGDPGVCIVLNNEKQVVFGQQINPHIPDFGQMAAYAPAPDPEQFADLVRAGELFQDNFRSFLASAPKLDTNWLDLGESILAQTSLWLRYYYFTAEARQGQEAAIVEARGLCQTIAGRLEAHPDFANADTKQTLLTVKARNAAFWVNTPEQCLPLYRAMIAAGQWPLVRHRFYNAAYKEVSAQLKAEGYPWNMFSEGMERVSRYTPQEPPANPANPCLAGWAWADRQRCPTVWHGFIDELCNSSQPATSVEGQILRCSHAWSEADFEQSLNQLLDYTRQQHDAIIATEPGRQLLDDLHKLVSERAEVLAKERCHRIQDQLWPAFEREFTNWLNQAEQAGTALQEDRDRQAELEKKMSYLNSQTNFDFASFAKVLLSDDYRPVEARQLLPLVTNYAARISGNQPVNTGNRATSTRSQMEQYQAKSWIGSLENKLSKVIPPPPPETNPPVARAARPVHAAPQIPASAASPAPAATNTLDIGHFWKIPKPEGLETEDMGDGTYRYAYFEEEYAPQIASCCYRDGKLWVEVRYDQSGDQGRADFISINLETLAADKIHFEGERFSLPNLAYRKKTHPFEVYDGYLYLSLGNFIRRYSLKTHAWEQFPVPATDEIMPVRLGNRLFFSTSSSILEYTADGSFKTLASSRRRPSLSLLDSVENYGSPHLFLTRDQTLNIRAGDAVYAFSTQSNNWFEVARLPGVDDSNYYPFDDGFVALTGRSPRAWEGIFGHESSPQMLFRQPEPGRVIPGRPQPAKTVATLWQLDIPSMELCLQDSNLWFLVNSPDFRSDGSHHLQSQAAHGANPALVCFTIGETRPVTIPVNFKTDDITTTRAVTGMLSHSSPQRWESKWMLLWTPQGLVMIHETLPGFWLIPAKDLTAIVQNAYSQRQLASEATIALHEQQHKELATKYDQNQDGILDPNETEAMIDDPRYLELELPVIDANTNGLLDAGELRFFDANRNGVLDPKEQNAIEITLSLLAKKLVAAMTPDADGMFALGGLPKELLSPSELRTLSQPGLGGMGFHDRNKISEKDVEARLKSHLTRGLLINGRPAIPRTASEELPSLETVFKVRVEEYWKFHKEQINPPASSVRPQP